MYWIRNGITGAAVVNRALQVLYFPRYSDAYMFIHKRSLNEKTYDIIQIGAIVSRETMERSVNNLEISELKENQEEKCRL